VHLFLSSGFFDRQTCARIRAAMDAGTSEPSEVLGDDIALDIGLDEDVRRAASIDVDDVTLELIEGQLDARRDEIGGFFGLTLVAREGTSLLRYAAGGFYKPHRDYAADSGWPGAALRRIAVVVFLGSSCDEDPAGRFAGGWLRLFPDDGEPIDVRPREGTLVAFPADTLHEVTVVRDGVRDTLVDWFY
jgi:predicted 2-oxoglutarate/Fe(II)-dependent dioxygenase YbiX